MSKGIFVGDCPGQKDSNVLIHKHERKKRHKNVHFCNFFAYIIQFAASMTLVKFRFCEKATKKRPSRPQGFEVTISNIKTLGMIRPNFCGLLRISELYTYVHM